MLRFGHVRVSADAPAAMGWRNRRVPPLDCRAASSRVPGEEDLLMSRTSVADRVVGRGLALLGAAHAGRAAPAAGLQQVRRRRSRSACRKTDESACIAGTMGSRADPIADVDVILTKPDGTDRDPDHRGRRQVRLPGHRDRRVPRRRRPGHAAQGLRAPPAGRGGSAGPDGALKVDVALSSARRTPRLSTVREPRTSTTARASRDEILAARRSTASGSVCCWRSPASASRLIYGTTGLSNFAHAEQVTLGGMVGYGLVNVLGHEPLARRPPGGRCLRRSAAGSRTACCGSHCDGAGSG